MGFGIGLARLWGFEMAWITRIMVDICRAFSFLSILPSTARMALRLQSKE
jgi:hypothetical protein